MTPIDRSLVETMIGSVRLAVNQPMMQENSSDTNNVASQHLHLHFGSTNAGICNLIPARVVFHILELQHFLAFESSSNRSHGKFPF